MRGAGFFVGRDRTSERKIPCMNNVELLGVFKVKRRRKIPLLRINLMSTWK